MIPRLSCRYDLVLDWSSAVGVLVKQLLRAAAFVDYFPFVSVAHNMPDRISIEELAQTQTLQSCNST